MNKVSYTKEQRIVAEMKNLPLVTIDYDDRHLTKGCGRYTYQGTSKSESLATSLYMLREYLEATCPDSPALKMLVKQEA